MDVMYGCKLLVISEIDPATGLIKAATPKVARIETPQQMGVAPQFSEGQRQELRGGDKLLAVVEDDPELIGIDLTFVDAELNGEAMALIGGGTYTADTYTPPVIGAVKTPFVVAAYVAQYAEGSQNQSDIEGYVEFKFNYAKGRIPGFTAQDRNFLVPQYTISCRQNNKASLGIFTWKKIATLPAV